MTREGHVTPVEREQNSFLSLPLQNSNNIIYNKIRLDIIEKLINYQTFTHDARDSQKQVGPK